MKKGTRESLLAEAFDHLPLLAGRLDGSGAVTEIELGAPVSPFLANTWKSGVNLLELLPAQRKRIQRALTGGRERFQIVTGRDGDRVYLDADLTFDEVRGQGCRFSVVDVTKTRELQIKLLDCADQEQVRIGRELHDGAARDVVAVRLQLEHLKPRLGDSGAEIEELQSRLGECIRSIQAAAHELAPVVSTEELSDALQRLVEDLNKVHECEATLTVELGEPIRSDAVAFNLVRIAQEAAFNAARHARASGVRIHLETGKRNRLLVADDGRGFDPESATSTQGGIGLYSLRDRADVIGAALTIDSGDGGTRVQCDFVNRPLPRESVTGDACDC